MPIKETTRFETTDGTLYTNQKEAQRAQEAINNKDRKSFRLKTWEDFVTKQLNSPSEEIKKIYGNLTRGNYGVAQSQDVFDRLWLGTVKNIKNNQRQEYSIMLNTIITGGETHIKADGNYQLTVNKSGAGMSRSVKTPYSLSATIDGETYNLNASPGGFTLSNGKGTIGTAQFVDNRWSVTFNMITHSIDWSAGK